MGRTRVLPLQSPSLSNAVVIQICAFHVPQNQLRSFLIA